MLSYFAETRKDCAEVFLGSLRGRERGGFNDPPLGVLKRRHGQPDRCHRGGFWPASSDLP